jgi:hypothetical protein
LRFHLPTTQELVTRSVHRQVLRCGAGSARQFHPQRLLESAHGAVVENVSRQASHAQQTFSQAQALAQSQAKQAFDAQAERDGGTGKKRFIGVRIGRWPRLRHRMSLSSQMVSVLIKK